MLQNGLSTEDRARWKKHVRDYGQNRVSGRFRLRIRFGWSPLFYLFLLAIVAAEYVADQFYYGYANWWMQGTFMLLIVIVTLGFYVFPLSSLLLLK